MSIEKLINEFKIFKIDVEGRAESSVDLYIKRFEEFCEDMKIKDYTQVVSCNSQTIKEWLSILANKGNSATTRNNKLSAVKQFYVYLENEKDEKIDRKIQAIKYAKTQRKESKYVDKEIEIQLISVMNNQRVKAAIILTMQTGVRFKELMQITCQDIERGNATILGKGNKERTIYFTKACQKICNDFINGSRKRIVEKTKVKSDILLLNNNGNLLTRQSFSKSLKFYADKIGLYWSDEISPHKLRHGCLTIALEDGIPVNDVRDMAGHSSIATTNTYAHTKQERVRLAMLREDGEYY